MKLKHAVCKFADHYLTYLRFRRSVYVGFVPIIINVFKVRSRSIHDQLSNDYLRGLCESQRCCVDFSYDFKFSPNLCRFCQRDMVDDERSLGIYGLGDTIRHSDSNTYT